jgi:hypothetical protein
MPIDDVLLKAQIVDPSGLASAKEVQKREGVSLIRAVEIVGAAKAEDAAAAIAKATGIEYIPPDQLIVSSETFDVLTPEFCKKALVLPVGRTKRGLRLAMANPNDYSTIQLVEFRAAKPIIALITTESGILKALKTNEEAVTGDKVYNLLHVVNPSGEVEALQQPEYDLASPAMIVKDSKKAPIVRLVNLALSEAVAARASDIHIEPQETFLQVRYRVDGVLRDGMKIPRQMQDATDFPLENHLGHRHLRTTKTSGRAHSIALRRPPHRHAGVHSAHAVR